MTTTTHTIRHMTAADRAHADLVRAVTRLLQNRVCLRHHDCVWAMGRPRFVTLPHWPDDGYGVALLVGSFSDIALAPDAAVVWVRAARRHPGSGACVEPGTSTTTQLA